MYENNMAWSPTPITYQHLALFGFDLTERAARGELELGEKDETGFKHTLQILCRRKMNNPILLSNDIERCRGIVKWFAHCIVRKDATIPRRLFYNDRIFWLNLETLFEGIETSAEFDARFDPLIEEVENKSITLYVENIERILGLCVPEIAINAPQRFRKSIRRGELRLISTSTLVLKELTECVLWYPAIDRSLAFVPLDSLAPASEDRSPAP